MRAPYRTSILWLGVAIAISGALFWIGCRIFHASKDGSRAETVVTTDEVRANFRKFAGKEIRLTGQLDECFAWECSLCPETMTTQDRNPKRCLALSFRPLIPDTGFGSDQQEEVFRFASVVLTAKFDPSCWEDGCVDRQTVLYDANVTSVHQRRASSEGLWLGNYSDLSEIIGPRASQLKNSAFSAGYPQTVPFKAFKTNAKENEFVVCWTAFGIDNNSPGAWPSTLEGALYARSTRDFYRCNSAREVEGRMVVQAEG